MKIARRWRGTKLERLRHKIRIQNEVMKKKMKLFVWENVLSDYTDGVVFALAPSVDAARRAVLAKFPGSTAGLDAALLLEPKVVTKTEGFAVWGGG